MIQFNLRVSFKLKVLDKEMRNLASAGSDDLLNSLKNIILVFFLFNLRELRVAACLVEDLRLPGVPSNLLLTSLMRVILIKRHYVHLKEPRV